MTPDQVRGRHWAQRLKSVFNIDIETCSKCGGDVRIIASIEDPAVINKILAHLDAKVHPAGGVGCHHAVPHHRWA